MLFNLSLTIWMINRSHLIRHGHGHWESEHLMNIQYITGMLDAQIVVQE